MEEKNHGGYQIDGEESLAEGSDLRVKILTLTAGQCVPWHYHSEITDSFVCLEGTLVVEILAPRRRIEFVGRPGSFRWSATPF